MSAAAGYIAIVVGALGLSVCFGALVSRLLRVPLLSPAGVLAGLATLCCAQWALLELSANVRVSAWPLLLLALLSSGLALRSGEVRQALRERERLVLLAGSLAMSLTLFLLYYSDSLGSSLPRPSSLGNNDLPFYALLAQHLLEGDFQDGGRISEGALGEKARTDVSGVFLLLATLARLTGLSVATVLMPVLAFGVFLVVLALADLLRCVTTLPPWACVAAAGAGCSGSMFFYGVGQGFVSQYFGMAAFFTMLALAWGRDVESSLLTSAGRTAVPLVVLLFFYPHMAFLGTALVMGVLLLSHAIAVRNPAEWRGIAMQVVAVPLVGLALASAASTSRSVVALERTFLLQDITAGWVLGRVTLSQALGLQPFPGVQAPGLPAAPAPPGAHLASVSWTTGALALVVLCALAWALRQAAVHRDRGVLLVRTGVVVATACGSYATFYAYYGPSYQQWKWALFLQPLLPAFAAAGVLVALRGSLSPEHRRPSSWSAVLPPLAMAATAAAVIALPIAAGGPSSRLHSTRVDDALVAISVRSDAPASGAAGIDMRGPTPYWDTMWAAFYSRADRNELLSPSYFPMASTPLPGIPIVRRDEPGAAVTVSPLNLTRIGPPSS